MVDAYRVSLVFIYIWPYVGRPDNNPDRYGKMSGFVKILITTIVKNMLSTSEQSTGSSIGTKISFDSTGEGICEGLKLWEKHFKHGFVYEQYNSEYYPKEYEQYKVGWPFSLFKEKRWHPFDQLFEACDKVKDEKKKAKIAWIEFPLPKYLNRYCPMQAEEKFKSWSRVDWFVEKTSKDNFNKMLCSVVEEGVNTIESKYSFGDKILGDYPTEARFNTSLIFASFDSNL
jgi:hypothetical protein